MIDPRKLKNTVITDEQLDYVTGGTQLTYGYIENLKAMLNEHARQNISVKSTTYPQNQ